MANPYSVLGIRPTAQPDEVKAAYRKMAMRFHPDRAGDDPRAAARMAAVNAAYDQLKTLEQDVDEGPPNPTTYMRLLTERELAALHAFVQKLDRKAHLSRRISRLTGPFAKPKPAQEYILLSAIRSEDDGVRLIFDGVPTSDGALLVLPELRQRGAGQIAVAVEPPKVVPAPARPARASTIHIKAPEDYVADFSGTLHLHFDKKSS